MPDLHDIKRRPRALHFIAPTLLIFNALAAACTGTREQTQTTTVTTSQPSATQATPAAQATPSAQATATASASPAATPASAPPPPAEVNDKLAHIFKGAAAVDPSQPGGALVGDFNGDGSQDIAVVVKPDPARLDEFNNEASIWILNDPHKVVLPDPTKTVQRLPASAPVKIEPGDVLLAVIHGFDAQGWRNPEAQQTYVLKNAAARDLRVESRQQALAEYKLSTQRLRGDCIRASDGRAAGLIYWMGAKYAWLPAKEK